METRGHWKYMCLLACRRCSDRHTIGFKIDPVLWKQSTSYRNSGVVPRHLALSLHVQTGRFPVGVGNDGKEAAGPDLMQPHVTYSVFCSPLPLLTRSWLLRGWGWFESL